MAINRGPFNALVDDDGSGTTGTLWNKSAIASTILDPVDVALAALPVPTGVWVDVPFNLANFWSDMTGGMVQKNRYMIIGKTMWWSIQILNATVPNPATPYLPFTVPGGITSPWTMSPLSRAFDSVEEQGYLFALGPTQLGAIKLTGTNWATYPIAVYFDAVISFA